MEHIKVKLGWPWPEGINNVTVMTGTPAQIRLDINSQVKAT